RHKMVGPYFRGHEYVATLDAGGAQAVSHVTLVVVHLGSVDVPVAETKRLFDDPRASAPAQIPRTEPQQWNAGAAGFDARGRFDRAHESHFGACGGLTILESGRFNAAISVISASLSSKSRLPRFSTRRSRFEVRGIGIMFCCSRNRSATCAGDLPCSRPMR